MNASNKKSILVQNDPYLEPFNGHINWRQENFKTKEQILTGGVQSLSDFANAHKYFGLHRTGAHWIFREWAPNATAIFLVGDFSNWQEKEQYSMTRLNESGTWEITLPPETLKHLQFYKLKIYWHGGSGERIPAYANYVVQNPDNHLFSAVVWNPNKPYQFKHEPPAHNEAPLIYESHVGMAQIEGKVSSYDDFRIHTLPRIKKAGYNTVQIMAIQEHPYYGSFGYQVSNFFAPSSRFGTPDDLKRLIDEAHKLGLKVIMDIVHSHAVKNEQEGISKFDGTAYQYFHDGGKGEHPAWDTRCFDYGKGEVIHFLLSNCKYWLEEFKFDGFRFDGVTSMLYYHHGLGAGFGTYDAYFSRDVDEDALAYFAMANKLIHELNPYAISIAEDVSGMPGLSSKLEDGGVGFDYRLSMGIPDFWIRTIKERKDEDWQVEWIFSELVNRRKDERVISYAESHDQALVGDKTLIFWLIDADMYTNMRKDLRNLRVDRGLALHKMIRLIVAATARGGYLNFMGNEFGHPEWIDFPREGNGWSHHYARRQWNLVDDEQLCYHYLSDFDKEMTKMLKKHDLLSSNDPIGIYFHVDDHVLAFTREKYLFVFSFDATRSYENYQIKVNAGKYKEILNSDNEKFGGFGRMYEGQEHLTILNANKENILSLFIPTRTAIVLEKID